MRRTEQHAAAATLTPMLARLDPIAGSATANPDRYEDHDAATTLHGTTRRVGSETEPEASEYEVRARRTVNTAQDACLAFRDQQFDIALVHVGPAARD